MTVLGDVRYSVRSLARTPGLTSALLLTISLGIGVTASVHAFVGGLVAPPLSVPQVDSLVSVFAWDAQRRPSPVSPADLAFLRRRVDVFEWVGAVRESQAAVVLADRASVMSVAAVDRELANLLHLDLHEGAVISHRVWLADLDGADEVGSTALRIDGVESRVAAIAPAELEGVYAGRPVDLWLPFREEDSDSSGQRLWAFGRLRRGVSIDRAQAAVSSSRTGESAIAVMPYSGMTPDMATGLLRMSALLRAATAAVFLIACANVASFMLARASARSRATSVRVAIGATGGDIARLLISDSVAISVAGGALGLLLAVWTAQVIPALLFEQDADRLRFAPDLASIAAVCALCAAITIACGLLPLVEARRHAPASVLQRESAGPSKGMGRLRAGLVAVQMALCFVLMVSTGLLLDGFRSALQTSAGRRLGDPILATMQARLGFERSEQGLDYFTQAERAALSVPGVTGAAWVSSLPGSWPVWQSLRVEPSQLPTRDVVIDVAAFPSLPSERLRLQLVAGRMFGGGDTLGACPVAVVNDVSARELFDADAVGRVVADKDGQTVEIVGVIATPKPRNGPVASRPAIYYAPDQVSPAFDRLGPAVFRTAVRPKLASVVLDANVISGGYFDAVGWSPIAGTIFRDDPASHACRVAVIDQEAADRYFGGHAVGAAVIDAVGRRTSITGVVQSAMLRSSQRRVEPAIYFPMTQEFRPRMTLMLGAPRADEALLALVRHRLGGIPGGAAAPVVTTLQTHLSRTALAPERIATVLVGAFAATAVALGIIGLYGAMADAARQRRREMAVRIALGAQRWRVIGHVMAEGARLAAAGAAAGMLGSFVVARWLASTTLAAGSLTVWVWLSAFAALVGAVAIASVLPARRAVMLNPFTIGRRE